MLSRRAVVSAVQSCLKHQHQHQHQHQRRLFHQGSRALLSASPAPAGTGKQAPANSSSSTAGPITQSFCKGIYTGELLDYKLFPFPVVLNKEEKEMLDSLIEPVDKFFKEKVDSKRIDAESKIPQETLKGLKELGLYGLQIPEEYGGLGLSNTKYARVVESIAMDASIAVTLMAHQSIGLKGILMFGTDAQKAKYLPRLASGEHTAAFCLTEPSSGSDAASIKTRAKLSPDGKHWLLSGGKCWISNGGYADIMTVFARTEVTDKATGATKDKITAFIVERAFGNITSGKPEDKLGIRGSNTTEVHFDNTPIPPENVIGEVGGGFKVAMNILNSGRFGLGAGSAGSSKTLISLASAYATTRTQFGSPLSSFGLIEDKFAQMAVSAYAMESMAYMTTGLIDSGEPDCAVEAAICKVYGSEAVWTNINEALQVFGGSGFMKAYPYERYLRDCRILQIFEGTNEILRMFIALNGVQVAGERLKGLQAAAKKPFTGDNLGLLKDEFERRFFPNMRAKRSAVKFSESLHPRFRDYGITYSKNVVAFGRVVDKLLQKYKKEITHQQLILRRMADITIDMYGIAAVLSRATKSLQQNSATADHEILLVEVYCKQAQKRIRANLLELEHPETMVDKSISLIAKDLFKKGAYVAPHPLDLTL